MITPPSAFRSALGWYNDNLEEGGLVPGSDRSCRDLYRGLVLPQVLLVPREGVFDFAACSFVIPPGHYVFAPSDVFTHTLGKTTPRPPKYPQNRPKTPKNPLNLPFSKRVEKAPKTPQNPLFRLPSYQRQIFRVFTPKEDSSRRA